MLYPKIEDCVEKAGNCKYILVAEIAKRAKDLAVRMPGQFEAGKEKEISYALREVFDGKLMPVFATGEVTHSASRLADNSLYSS
jgi:DNA-directed RNA polymerase omega subunit